MDVQEEQRVKRKERRRVQTEAIVRWVLLYRTRSYSNIWEMGLTFHAIIKSR